MPVLYRSTRGGVHGLSFVDAVLCGLAADGGLLVPESVPQVDDVAALRGLSYQDLCYEILRLYISETDVPAQDLRKIIAEAYQAFRKPDCVDYSTLEFRGTKLTLMELFHGPTFAFKDFALQFLGRLMSWILQQRAEALTILGATSGDTGSAAISGFDGVPNVKCCILYPDGKTSKLQELQMITASSDNVQCLALDGACFDDCQRIVKEIFESPLKSKFRLSAVNSINWARILAQTVYYWHCALRSFPGPIDVVVPTGNFGNALAAHYAKLSGAPIRHLVIAANSNDCLPRFLSSGCYAARPVIPTMSPSMDIQLSSNFERGIFICTENDAKLVDRLFNEGLKQRQAFEVEENQRAALAEAFLSFKATEDETLAVIREAYAEQKVLVDPHTAVGIHCAKSFAEGRTAGDKTPIVVASTAHCGKFPEAIATALSAEVAESAIPAELKKLRTLKTKYKKIPATAEAVSEFLRSFVESG